MNILYDLVTIAIPLAIAIWAAQVIVRLAYKAAGTETRTDEAAKRVAIERIANELRREAERRERLQRQQQAKQTTWEVYDPNHTDPYDQENNR